MSSISDVIGKIHFLTSVALEADITRNSASKSKCACCGVETATSSVNFFDTYGRRLKTLFGVNFKERTDSVPVGPNVQSLESLWTICDLCVKQLEVAELLFWKVFRTHDMEVLVTTLDDGRELYQLRQSGVPIEEPTAENNFSGGVIVPAEEPAAEGPPAKKARKGDQKSLNAGLKGDTEPEAASYLETSEGLELGAGKTTTNTTTNADDETEYASLIQCDFCGNYIVEMEKGMLAEHRRNCASNPLGTKKFTAPVVEDKAPAKPPPVIEDPVPEVESISFYVCHLCNGPVKTEELLKQHYLTVHKTCPEDLSKYKTVSTNVCPWCMAPFQSAKAKKRHMTSRCVRKPGYELANAANSGGSESNEQQQFKCKYCSLLFPSLRSRFNHFYRAHNRYK